MSKEKRRVPKLRFPGFTEDWEQRKLESLFTKYEDKVSTPDSGYWRLGLRSHCKGTFYTYVDAGHELETTEMYRVKAGNFILNITFAWERALAVTDDEDQGKLVSHRFPQFKPNDDLVIDFFKHTLMDKRFKHHLELSSPGGAGRNKVLKVSDMLKYELLVPSIQEQNIISSFLNNVDYIITLHQRKLNNLKLKKKALLQKLFPKNGERYPELRFPGFADAWEQRKLTSFTQRVKGNDGRMDLPTLTISASEGWLNQKDRFSANIAGSEQKNYTLLRQGELSYNHGNSKLAKYGVVYALKDYKEALVPRVYHSFRVDESYDALFVEYYFSTKRPDRELGKLVSSGARMDGLLNIGYDEFTNISISVPTFSEQKQIVALLKVCDKYITLHQRKLDHLQLQKKALLQQMFV